MRNVKERRAKTGVGIEGVYLDGLRINDLLIEHLSEATALTRDDDERESLVHHDVSLFKSQ